jgi:DNA-binding transcriptional MerR regulator
MAEQALNIELPPIPAKRYFTIGEVSELCGVKPHVLRYWEQEFTQLSPVKRRGNRRYYQHYEVLLIRRIRALLYDDGFTISGARNLLDAKGRLKSEKNKAPEGENIEVLSSDTFAQESGADGQALRDELAEIAAILKAD